MIENYKENIFSDFFDTIMFRHTHPLDVADQWCRLVAKKYEISYSKVYNARKASPHDDYKAIYKYVYNSISMQEFASNIILDDFIRDCLYIETSCEMGAQYPNIKYLNQLRRLKEKGHKIFIVSDFHLPKESFVDFLKAQGVELSLFNDIFVSSDCKCRKSTGELYSYLLKRLSINKDSVIMIGDNKSADGNKAKECGIDSIIIPNYVYKIRNHIVRRLGIPFNSRALKCKRADMYKYNTPYIEYSLLFYLSSRELYRRLTSAHQTHVSFLSREGHFMKRAFEEYQRISVSGGGKIKADYLKCSRRAAQSTKLEALMKLPEKMISLRDWLFSFGFTAEQIEAIKDKFNLSIEEMDASESILIGSTQYTKLMGNQSFIDLIKKQHSVNTNAASKYFAQFVHGNHLNIVDIGWRGHMQETIGNLLSVRTDGYYLGINNADLDISNKHGLLFTYCPLYNCYSRYADILKSNIQLYEQLTAAPHGSALGYKEQSGGEILVAEDWAENEKFLYENYIQSKQQELILQIRGLSSWCEETCYDKALRLCAKTVLRSALIADKNRLEFLKALDAGFIWNFNKQLKGLNFDRKKVTLGFDILYAPERYTRYFAKVQRTIQNKSILFQKLYIPFAWMLYGYIWCFCLVKRE